MNLDKQNFYNEFKWALPKAFKDPLANCRFEQGDTIYDTQKAHSGSWQDALRYLKHCIQIELPIRGLKTIFKGIESLPDAETTDIEQSIEENERKGDERIFTDNWNSDVSLILTKYPSKNKKNITTTQGHLYMTLWKGNIDYLEKSNRDLPVPRLPKDSLKDIKDIKSTEKALMNMLANNLNYPKLFVMPNDETRDIQWSKYLKVKKILEMNYTIRELSITPDVIGFPGAAEYVPTLRFACFIVDTKDRNVLFQHLKKALYTPTKKRKAETDRFIIEKHGYLFPQQ